MSQQLLQFQGLCDEFYEGRDFQNFALSATEWKYVNQMGDFLEPLSEGTEIICKSKFPSMHQLVPIYIVVLQGLKSVSILFGTNIYFATC